MKTLLAIGLLSILLACDQRDVVVGSSDAFCRGVLPAVDAFMASAREANSPPDDPRYGGTVVVGTIEEMEDGMNSAISRGYSSAQHQHFVNLMTLVAYDSELTPQPYLAESWNVSSDHTAITFHLRRDVFWHDGEQTDAHDVAFTYRTVTDPLTAFPNAAAWDRYARGLDGVQILDDFTVRIQMEAHSGFLEPFRTLGILPEHLLGDVPPNELAQHPYGTQCPVGNGPFVFASHDAQDRWVFEANPAFPVELGGRPFVDRYVYRVIPEQSTLLTELLTENIDVYVAPNPDQAQRILDAPELELRRFANGQYVFVGWNARRPQLADSRVRRAITMATNRDEFVQSILQGYGTVANTGIPPFHWAYEEAVTLGYDPEGARTLLDEAGWADHDGDGVRESPEGLRLAFSIKYNHGNQQRQAVAEVMQAQLADIGIEVRPQVVEWATLIEQITSPDIRDFDGVVMGFLAGFKIDETDLFHSERIDEPYAWSGTANPEIDRLLEAIRTSVDPSEAQALWVEYQRAILEEQPNTYFYLPERLAGVNKRLHGVEMDARGEWLGIRHWYLDDAAH